MNPEEKLAKRLLERHNIEPPYDLNELVINYANLHFVSFPSDFKVDGMSVNLKKSIQPDIYINTCRASTRIKFSIAHELGHVLIPWHKGNIVSHSDNLYSNNTSNEPQDEYWLIESEANRFAAELLLPTSWLQLKLDDINLDNFQNKIQNIIDEAGTSRYASLIKIFNILRQGFACAEIDESKKVIRSFVSNNTPAFKLSYGTDCSLEEPYPAYEQKKYFNLGNNQYILWTFKTFTVLSANEDSRSWRKILNEILEETQLHEKKQSINAVLGSVYESIKNLDDSEVFNIIMHRYHNKNELLPFIQHPLSEQYIAKRIKELKNRNNLKKIS